MSENNNNNNNIIEFTEAVTEVESVQEVGAVSNPTGTINFNNEQVKLKFPLYSLIKLEDVYGVKLADLEHNSDSVSLIAKLVWAGLLYKNPDLTLDEVAMQFDISDLSDIAGAISSAVSKTVGK